MSSRYVIVLVNVIVVVVSNVGMNDYFCVMMLVRIGVSVLLMKLLKFWIVLSDVMWFGGVVVVVSVYEYVDVVLVRKIMIEMYVSVIVLFCMSVVGIVNVIILSIVVMIVLCWFVIGDWLWCVMKFDS